MSLLNANTNVIPTYKSPKFIPSPELQLIMDRAAEEGFNLPSPQLQAAIDALISNMKEDGFWQANDSILNFAYNTTTLPNFSRINWKNPFSITNLVTFSTDWSNAGWTSGGAVKTPNTTDTTAPDGTMTACKFDDTNASSSPGVPQKTGIIANSTTLTYSIYTKAGTALNRIFRLRDDTAGATRGSSILDYTTGTTMGGGTAVNVGNGWYRLSITVTNCVIGNSHSIYYGRVAAASIGATDTWYCWGPMIENRNQTSRYIPTGATPIYGNGLATIVGGMVYTTSGYKGNGIDGYIDTRYNPIETGVNYTLNNAGRGSVLYVGGTIGAAIDGIVRTSVNMMLYSQITLAQRINSNVGDLDTAVNFVGTGLKHINRTSATDVNLVNTTQQFSRTQSSSGVANDSQVISKRSTAFGDLGFSNYYIGGAITFN